MTKVELIPGEQIDSDLGVVNAARVSFSKWGNWAIDPETGLQLPGRLERKDSGLLRYLAVNNHWTPYAHGQIMMRRRMNPRELNRWLLSSGAGFHREILEEKGNSTIFIERGSLYGYMRNWSQLSAAGANFLQSRFPETLRAHNIEVEQRAEGHFESATLACRDQNDIERLSSGLHVPADLGNLAMISMRVDTSLFIAAQLKRHAQGLVVNEVSRRYVDDEPEFWVPEKFRLRPEGSIKQGSGGVHPNSGFWRAVFRGTIAISNFVYGRMILNGIAPEMARAVLPTATMTQWVWTGSLADCARVCQLRLDGHAQKESRDIAEGIDAAARIVYPDLWPRILNGAVDRAETRRVGMLQAA